MAPPYEPPAKRHRSNREEETIRLMLQSLSEMGYSDSVQTLQQESGLSLESETVANFRSCLVNGQWDQAELVLDDLDIDKDLNLVKFLVRKQKYLEALFHDSQTALSILRTELAPLDVHHTELHNLSSFMMMTLDELKKKLKWSGYVDARQNLLKELQKFIPAAMMIPPFRLQTLLEQATQKQTSACMYHNSLQDEISLYTDHVCDRNRFPTMVTHTLHEHSDEVWFLAYSHDGTRLASASKDSHCIIWDTKTYKVVFDLLDHSEAISFLSWSPDDSMLLTASNDHSLKVWNTRTGQCIHTYAKHTEPVTSCAWLPDGKRFVSGSLEKNIYLWDLDGEVLHKWSGIRTMDLAISKDGRLLIVASEKKIRLYDLEDKSEVSSLSETDSITSVYVAADGRHLLVNLSIQEIHLWDLKESQLIRKFVGQKQGRFVIRSCFGGVQENFVLSGSEDSQVYIWHRGGTLIENLQGHGSCVNCVAWNPTQTSFASASDDNTIRIWGPQY